MQGKKPEDEMESVCVQRGGHRQILVPWAEVRDRAQLNECVS